MKRVSGRRVLIRSPADIQVQRGEAPPGLQRGRCLLPAGKLLLHSSPQQRSRMMRKQSEQKISTVVNGCFKPRTIPNYVAGFVTKGVCPGTWTSGRLSHWEPDPHSAKMFEGESVFNPVLWDWVRDNKTIGTHQGITWCDLDIVSIMDPISLIIDMGRAGRGSVPAGVRETMWLRATWFSTHFRSRKQFFGVNRPSTH